MSLLRPWLLLVLAGCPWADVARGQVPGEFVDPFAPAPAPGTAPGQPALPTKDKEEKDAKDKKEKKEKEEKDAAEATPKPKPPAPGTGGTGGTTIPPRNPFGFEPLPEPAEGTTPARPSILSPRFGPGGNGASTTFGPSLLEPAPGALDQGTTGQGKPRNPNNPNDNPITFSAPGFYGSGQQTFRSGEGRFAKPRFRYGVSAGIGFDDNYQQTPDKTGSPEQIVVQVIPATPEVAVIQNQQQLVQRRVFPGGPVITEFRNVPTRVVLQPAQPEQRIETVIPAVPPSPRLFSLISTVDVSFSTQWAKLREALTLDLRVGAEYYFDREIDPLQYNGSFSLNYIRKLTNRAQFSGSISISHSSQPDYSQINVDTRSGGAVTSGFLKVNLGYRWGPRFSTNTSAQSQIVMYEAGTASALGNFYDVTLGNEFRYIWSRRMTMIAEVRETTTEYVDDPTRNSDTLYLLLGLDQQWNRRLSTTLRLGESYRTFKQGGEAQVSPYGELSAAYQPNSRSQFTLQARYGFEASAAASQENVTFRTSLSYARLLTPRLSSNINVAYVDSQNTSKTELGDFMSGTQTFDGGLSFGYRFDRHFSLNARYSYTMLTSNPGGFSDYDRSRFFVTGNYDF